MIMTIILTLIDRCQLYGLGVRRFKVSGGAPSPPEQTPGSGQELEGKLRRVKRKTNKSCYIYIYI